ncbi:MAG: hypothetical protein VYD05_06205, partial [Planctomycetota bacterium]|nr:hypothetical protein [Planctomycetota bacterium]
MGRRWLAREVRDALYRGAAEEAAEEAKGTTARAPDEKQDGAGGAPATASLLIIFGEAGTGKSAFVGRVLDAAFCEREGAPWAQLHRRVLARHMCRVQDADSLDPLRWARGLAGQIFLAAARAGHVDAALGVLGHGSREAFAAWLGGEGSFRGVLRSWVIPALETLGGPDKLGGKDTIWVDSLDEALTASVALGNAGPRSPDTVVSALREFRRAWPPWLRLVATSRPDRDTKAQLRALDGPRIDVGDENNRADIRAYVERRLRNRGFRLVKDTREARRAHLLQLRAVRDMLDPATRGSVKVLSRTFFYAPQEQRRVICAKAAG